MNNSSKRTKILATIGPATNAPEQIEAMIRAGANGLRLNFSHGTYEERLRQIPWIREASERVDRPVAILQDLQGPKIRLGELVDNHLEVKAGDILTLDSSITHDGGMRLPVQYNLAEKAQPGQPVYLFDGKVKTIVREIVCDTAITVEVQNNGILMSKKGINLPDTQFGGDILTEKDIRDIEFGADKDIDYVALSFVQTAEDINNLRQILVSHGSTADIVAKIETKVAIQPENLEEIIKASDAVMVARGDLAVEAGAEVVPIVQRKIIDLCNKHGRLSIVATQMMASMVDAPEPTRAEVSDVANAVVQATDAVMLSDETANGSYPIEAVAAMKRAIVYTQDHIDPSIITDKKAISHTFQDSICRAAAHIAEEIGAVGIIAETKSGATAANIAAVRPQLSIYAVTSEKRTAQQLALSYATRSFIRPDGEKAGTTLAYELMNRGVFGDTREAKVVIVSGRQPGVVGGTDTIRVRIIKASE